MFSYKALPFEEITPQQAEQRMKNSKSLVIDVREPYEYAQGHIEGSKLLSLGNLTANIHELCSKDQEIILVCRSGSRSGFAAQQLSAIGYKKVYNLSGGMLSWMRAGLPTTR
ncbi:MAG: rhodanese-like domain-containing protein [Chloroflexi bacterium]|uniref:Rhodanese-like domain-containing protein n=1 Tax=Candidatus Chlorohelix allophototropha TaxID=3003348 RepID=A0A8T7M4I0_9CHLR|nr:rhodanese-like domain-containing protein [Chloroflexota bacterium]WJW70028.1 rhodanese-like domain-containing protein [Chloroflexota bacterium L227-S17]